MQTNDYYYHSTCCVPVFQASFDEQEAMEAAAEAALEVHLAE